MGGAETVALLLFETDEKKLSFRRVESSDLHPFKRRSVAERSEGDSDVRLSDGHYTEFLRASVRQSICLSVQPSHAGTVSKRPNVLSRFLYHTIAHSF